MPPLPPRVAPPQIPAGPPPNQTLYVTNLPSKKPPKAQLRVLLYTLFSTYGPVLDVVALRTSKMRGQAHVVFRDINAATQAMRALQGFKFLDCEMKIAYAKGRSNVIARLAGHYNPPAKPVAEQPKQAFVALPGSHPAPPPPSGPPPSLPPIPVANGAGGPTSLPAPPTAPPASLPQPPQAAGVKRPREEDDDGDDDDEGEMEMDED